MRQKIMKTQQNSLWRYGKICIVNISILIVLCAILEIGAWFFLFAYQNMQTNTRDKDGVQHLSQSIKTSSAIDLTSTYSSESVAEALSRHKNAPGSPYQYESYVVYGNRPYTSELINITTDGMRLNGQTPLSQADFNVWMFGSSALFGVSTADNETIPARLENILR